MIDKSSLGRHISHQFNAEIEDLRERVLTMGGIVERVLSDAVEALASGKANAMSEVKAEDRKVNHLEVFIDEAITQLIARRQPTASDLRLVLTVSRVIVDLERIGDESKKVYRMATRLTDSRGHHADAFTEAENLGQHVQKMLHGSLDSFARLDPEAALQVVREDDKVDREHEEIMRLNMTYMMEDPRNIKRAVDLMWAVRALERIGDHARNVAEHCIYMVTGQDVRYVTLEQVEEVVRSER